MRHIESDIINFLNRHIRINEYMFNTSFQFTFVDTNMFGELIEVNCIANGITGKMLYGTLSCDLLLDIEWPLSDLDIETLTKILVILEIGNFK